MTYAEEYLKLTQDPRFESYCNWMQVNPQAAKEAFLQDIEKRKGEEALFEAEINSIKGFYDNQK